MKPPRSTLYARFVEQHKHLIIAGPVGVGKTFLAHALGHIACRHGYLVLAVRADKMLKTLKHARLDNSYEAEPRKFLAVDILIVDSYCRTVMLRFARSCEREAKTEQLTQHKFL